MVLDGTRCRVCGSAEVIGGNVGSTPASVEGLVKAVEVDVSRRCDKERLPSRVKSGW